MRSRPLDRYIGRLAEPEEVDAAILFLASPAASMITGHMLVVDGGYLAQIVLTPIWIERA
ncbi:MAG TPA: SDR family oxidoreductase [Bradyrhizobium sp.]|nr:SDR family oxidoreductase [Bradyrhizobium sp.]